MGLALFSCSSRGSSISSISRIDVSVSTACLGDAKDVLVLLAAGTVSATSEVDEERSMTLSEDSDLLVACKGRFAGRGTCNESAAVS